ncbi:methylamine utilization protein [Methylomonas rhizoryzae]|uniref:methylamine utilization protein n=1 Tax=Methylomonas rhizoryzae TaxID=2608981 RepID=UPI001232A20C|nr:methylamine utilization protein [Methylomonas rhizoryzae]
MAICLSRIFLSMAGAMLTQVSNGLELSGTVTDGENPVSHVVVSAHPQPASAVQHPSLKAVSIELDQKSREFVPHILAIKRGTPVYFPNSDDIKHHVYSFSSTKRFEIKLYSGTPVEPIVFEQTGIVTLGCNIHDWMLGYIYVTDAEYLTQSDREGRWLLAVPSGQYRVTLWHPDAENGEHTQTIDIHRNTLLYHHLPLKTDQPTGKPPANLQLQVYDGGF